ncbi:hypothetical protein DY000_02005801 [Brassica cretica]|uniref:Uncharacterized protein n=1 Tax=Brassica cretica TaxID=69181 RepID=A0ABQ7CGL5_BRACR|nr:hypothetical protein DY000_02005801 [Brassica cretica]
MSLPNRKLILISSLTYINDLNRKQAISILTLMHAIVFSNQAKLHVGCTALHRGADHLACLHIKLSSLIGTKLRPLPSFALAQAKEKLHQWIVRQEEEGTRVSTDDITTYLQNELEYEPEETSIPAPMQEFHHNHQFAPPNVHTSSAALAPSSHIAQHYDFNQEKVFLTQPNGLSSPVRRTLQDFSLREAEPGNHHHPNSTGQGFF